MGITIYHILHQLEYTGYTLNKEGERIESKIYTEKIISIKDFDEVQKRWPIQSTPNAINIGRPASHLVSGILTCEHCGIGYFFHFQKSPNGHSYYHNNNNNCKAQQNRVLSYLAINFLFESLYVLAMSQDQKDLYKKLRKELLKNKEEVKSEIEILETKIKETDSKITKLINTLENIDDDTILERLKQRKLEKVNFEKTLDKLKNSIKSEEERLSKIVANFSIDRIQQFKSSDEVEKRIMLKEIIESATIGGGIIKVKLIDSRKYKFQYEDVKKLQREGVKWGRVVSKNADTEDGKIIIDIISYLNSKIIEMQIEGRDCKMEKVARLLLQKKLEGKILSRVEEKSIDKIIQTIKSNPGAKFSLNIKRSK
jgi:hypothetical protein